MSHTIFVNGNTSAMIKEENGHCIVTAYVGTVPTVEYETTSVADAERWARVVIDYPA
jgi:hypothetical protein